MREFVTCDVFETVLVRPDATAKGMFERVAVEMQGTGLVPAGSVFTQEFVIRREAVDRHIWRTTEGRCDLRMLYQVLARDYKWTNDQVEAAKSIELAVEARCCVTVPSVLSSLRRLREEGKRVIFVSDTYLHGKELESILAKKGVLESGDLLYSSADYGLTKSSGKMFELIRREVGGDWIMHMGNDLHSDFKMARKANILAVRINSGNLSVREQNTLNEFRRHGLEELGSKLVGAARIARLKTESCCAPEIAARKTVLASVACPFFAAYALWIHRQLCDNAIDCVYFLARDGFLPKMFYDHISRLVRHSPSVYLHASRAAWHPATLDVDGYFEKWLFDAPEQLSLRRLMGRIRLSKKFVGPFKELLSRAGLSEDKVLDSDEISSVRAILCTPAGSELRIAIAKEKRELVNAYLVQMGLVGEQKHALVDLGWNGRLQHSLSLIRKRPVDLGLYAGLKSSASSGNEVGRSTAFLFDERQAIRPVGSYGLIGNCIQILESFGLAPHPSVSGYMWKHPSIVGIDFSERAGYAIEEGWSYSKLGSVFEDYLAALEFDERDRASDPNRLGNACAALLKDFVLNPTYEEANIWGAFPFVSDQAGGELFELGRPLPPINASYIASAMMGNIPYGPAAIWRVASRKRTPYFRLAAYFSAAAPMKAGRRLKSYATTLRHRSASNFLKRRMP